MAYQAVIRAGRFENGYLPDHYDLETKTKLRELAQRNECSMRDVVIGLIQREYQRTIGTEKGA